MATVLPPPSKRQKLANAARKEQKAEDDRIPDDLGNIRIQFVDHATGEPTSAPISLPVAQSNVKNLEELLNSLRNEDQSENRDRVPYTFTFHPDGNAVPSTETSFDISRDVYHSIILPKYKSTEDVITLRYTPQAIFRVRAVTRCSAAISGHDSAILATQFSPLSSSRMVSGCGDATARIWDCDTGTPFKTLKGHTSWVLAVSYSPDSRTIATGSMDNTVRLWDATTGDSVGTPLRGHTKWITSLAWEPYHLQEPNRPRLASASKDASVRIWDITSGRCDQHLTRHTSTVSCVKWGGTGRIYTCSHDKTVKVWDAATGALLHNMTAHAHWVNHLALSTDAVLRTAFFDHRGEAPPSDTAKRAVALERFTAAATVGGRIVERIVTASDDCTIFLWDSGVGLGKPVARLTGHQKQVNHVTFSHNGRLIASCGFDNHVKLWQGHDGRFLFTLRGHVAPVYQCAFSADSRLLVSASKDTTVKCWDVRTGALMEDLPGHQDEVYAVDWSGDGKRVASGGKDKQIRIWTN